MFKLNLGKTEEPEIKLPTSAGSWKKQEFQKNIYFCFIDYAKAFDCVDHNKVWKMLLNCGVAKLNWTYNARDTGLIPAQGRPHMPRSNKAPGL